MVQWKDLPRQGMENAKRLTREQLDARRKRLEAPDLQAKIDATKENLWQDTKDLGWSGFCAVGRLTIGAPAVALWKGITSVGDTFEHNQNVKAHNAKIPIHASAKATQILGFTVSRTANLKVQGVPRNEKNYKQEMFSTAFAELTTQYGKGLIDASKFFGNLLLIMGRGSKIIVRKTLGI